jgi:hypothetical protein
MKRLATVTPLHYFDRTTPDLHTGCWPFRNRQPTQGGYVQVWHPSVPHRKGVRRHAVLVHRLIWELVYGPIPVGLHVLHRCDNPPCINPEHLFLGTRQDNMDDKVAKHRQVRGERQRFAKLTPEQIRQIRALAHELNHVEIARQFGVTAANVGYIVRRHTWKHID